MSDELLVALTPELLTTLIEVHAAIDRVLDAAFDRDAEAASVDVPLVSADGVAHPLIAPILMQHGWTGRQYRAAFYSTLIALHSHPVNGHADVWTRNCGLVAHPPDHLAKPLKKFKDGFFDPRGRR